MAHTLTVEEREVLKLFDKMPLTDRQKKQWQKTIQEDGLDQELLDKIRKKIVAMQKDKELNWNGTLVSTELTMIVKRWRLSQQTRSNQKRPF